MRNIFWNCGKLKHSSNFHYKKNDTRIINQLKKIDKLEN